MGDGEDGDDVGAARVQNAHRFARRGPGGDDVVDEQDVAGDRPTHPNASGDVALPGGSRQADRVPGEGAHPQDRFDAALDSLDYANELVRKEPPRF